MALFQGGYSNFAAKRAARHGKTKQYKESLKNQKVSDNKEPETKNDKKKSGDIKSGKGPALTFGPAVQNNLLKLLIDTAKKNKIDHQLMAASRFTGTDTDAFAYSNDGVASALISLPLKYMHTTVETVHKDDVESCIKLMYESVLAIKEGQDFRYIK